MAKDLTILFFTLNRLPEKWAVYHKEVLLEAAGDYPIITVSNKDLGIGQYLPDEPRVNSYYWQMLRAAKIATTPYVAITEDDTLYTKSHFDDFRPPSDTFGYNTHRWSLFTWGTPLYSWKNHMAGCACIAPRELIIECLEERFAKYPNGMDKRRCGEFGLSGPGYERLLRVTRRKAAGYNSFDPIIQFIHLYFSSFENTPENIKKTRKQRMGFVRASDIPYWGKSAELVKKFQ